MSGVSSDKENISVSLIVNCFHDLVVDVKKNEKHVMKIKKYMTIQYLQME